MSELMPYLDGITGYFDLSSVDLTNNKWLNCIDTNLVDKYDMNLPNGGTMQNNALYLTAAQYGELQMSTEPQTIYCVYKMITLSGVYSPVISKKTTTKTARYDYAIYANTQNCIYMTLSSYGVSSDISPSDYHVVCITKQNNTAYLYIDGVLIGSTTAYNGYFGGSCHINRNYRGTGFIDTPTDIEYRMCALGTIYHDEDKVKANTAFLLNGTKPKSSRLAGTDAVAIAYAIARNQESAASLQEMKKAYKDGIKQGIKDGSESTEDFDSDVPGDIAIDPIIDEPAVTNMSEGFWMGFGDKSTGTVTEYYRVYMIPFTETVKNSSGGTNTYSNYLKCAKYVNGELKETRSFGSIVGNYNGLAFYETVNPSAWSSYINTAQVTRVFYEGTKIWYYSHKQTLNHDGSIVTDKTERHWIFENINSDFIHMTNVSPF